MTKHSEGEVSLYTVKMSVTQPVIFSTLVKVEVHPSMYLDPPSLLNKQLVVITEKIG